MNNQSEDRVLGYVGTYPVGDYNEQTEYEYLNVVTHKGSSYVCIKEEGCIAVEPPSEECWQLFAGKGDTGEKGDKGDTGPIGPKPVNGVDYNTNAEREEFKNAVVADSKTDLEKYIAEKETQLDNYTKDKETKLDDYVTNTVKPTIDTYVTDTTKKDIDAYEKEKEKVLDTYTDTKKTEIDNYVANTSKPALDQYEKDKEAELETAKNTAISEYDAHAESVLTETEDLFNALNTEKASGTELYIEDAKPCRAINTEIDAMYAQKTTTGAQLLDSADFLFTNNTLKQNELEVVINEDGSITINGTATDITYLKKNLKSVLEDGNYYFYNFNNINQSNETYYMLIQGRKSTGYTSADYYNTRGYQTDNFIKDTETYDASFDCLFVFKEGFVANNLKLYPVISKTAQTGFEPYTGKIASPNPDYPQAIEQVDSVKLQCTGSNLLDYTKILSTPSTTSGITIKLEENGNITISGKPKYSYFSVIQPKNIIDILKDGETYYLDQSNYNRYFYTEIQAVKADGSITYIGPQKSYASFKVNKSLFKKYVIKIIGGSLTNWGEEERTVTSNFKLTRQKNLPFEKYIEKTVNIDLKGNKLCAVSDTIKDKLLIDRNGNVALQKNVNYLIFNNVSSVNVKGENSVQFLLNVSNIVKGKSNSKAYIISNMMQYEKLNSGICFYGTTETSKIRIIATYELLGTTKDDSNTTQVNALTTYLSNLAYTPEIYYAVETPEIIDLGQIAELPKTFNGINNIWAETNLGNTEIEIEYVQDVKKLLEKQAEQQNARLDNIEALLSTTQTSALLLDNMQTDLEKEVK